METMYASVFLISREDKIAGVRVVAAVACDRDTITVLKEMMNSKEDWPNTHVAISEGAGCITALVKTSNPKAIGLMNDLASAREESFVFLETKVEKVFQKRFEVKLGGREYFFTEGSVALEEIPAPKPRATADGLVPQEALQILARPRHRPRNRNRSLITINA